MPDTAPPPDLTADIIAGWIHKLTWLREDVAFGLDKHGIRNQLADVLDDMQDVRKQAGQ